MIIILTLSPFSLGLSFFPVFKRYTRKSGKGIIPLNDSKQEEANGKKSR